VISPMYLVVLLSLTNELPSTDNSHPNTFHLKLKSFLKKCKKLKIIINITYLEWDGVYVVCGINPLSLELHLFLLCGITQQK
jgi:hypothetical protein